MNTFLPKGLATAATIITMATASNALANNAEKVAKDLATSMEKFYGKPISSAETFLTKKFGISGPSRKEGARYVYMIPAKSPTCGELTVDTDENNVYSWQTIIWDRTEANDPGRACDKAFKSKVGSR
ncbi:MAG: hypothetical protein ACWA5X_08345 [bacterium]